MHVPAAAWNTPGVKTPGRAQSESNRKHVTVSREQSGDGKMNGSTCVSSWIINMIYSSSNTMQVRHLSTFYYFMVTYYNLWYISTQSLLNTCSLELQYVTLLLINWLLLIIIMVQNHRQGGVETGWCNGSIFGPNSEIVKESQEKIIGHKASFHKTSLS